VGASWQTYYSNSFTPFIVFFALFLVVVRSQKLPHFLRFNALQSMLLDISIMLSGLIIQYLPFEIQFSRRALLGVLHAAGQVLRHPHHLRGGVHPAGPIDRCSHTLQSHFNDT
jgi:hypothetical protein